MFLKKNSAFIYLFYLRYISWEINRQRNIYYHVHKDNWRPRRVSRRTSRSRFSRGQVGGQFQLRTQFQLENSSSALPLKESFNPSGKINNKSEFIRFYWNLQTASSAFEQKAEKDTWRPQPRLLPQQKHFSGKVNRENYVKIIKLKGNIWTAISNKSGHFKTPLYCIALQLFCRYLKKLTDR